jgi:hypothetical protein
VHLASATARIWAATRVVVPARRLRPVGLNTAHLCREKGGGPLHPVWFRFRRAKTLCHQNSAALSFPSESTTVSTPS